MKMMRSEGLDELGKKVLWVPILWLMVGAVWFFRLNIAGVGFSGKGSERVDTLLMVSVPMLLAALRLLVLRYSYRAEG